MEKGFDVRGMDAAAISRRMEKYVAEHFTGYKLGIGESLFQESHLFWLEEISGMLPEHYFKIFTDEDKFICMAGFIVVGNSQGEDEQHVISLVMDEHIERAYLLCLCEEADESGEDKITVIKDFLKA